MTTPLRYTWGTKHTHYAPCDRLTKQNRRAPHDAKIVDDRWRFDASAPRSTSRESTRGERATRPSVFFVVATRGSRTRRSRGVANAVIRAAGA